VRPALCHPGRVHQARGLCRACYSAWQRARNPEGSREYQRSWAAKPENREAKRAAEKRRRALDPAKSAARVLAWRKANRTRFNAGARALRAASPEKYRAQKRASEQKRRASRSTCTANAPTPEQMATLTAPGVVCFYCEVAPATSIDHVIPLARGGAHELGNMVGACQSCNSSKGSKLPGVEWRRGCLA
jgi:5-methylcytosine-specific restriction endonuclease McrA